MPLKKQREIFMESVIKESTGLKRKLELKIQSEDVNRSFLKNYQKIQQKVKLSGFRQGKVPLHKIKQNYKDQVLREVLDDLFKAHYPLALEREALNPASSPSLLNFNLQEGKEGVMLFEIEVHPEVKVENYLELELEKNKISVTKEHIDQALKNIQSSYKSFEESKEYQGPSKKGDTLNLSLIAFDSENNKVLEIKEQLFEELGQDTVLKDLDEKLLDMQKGEEKEFEFSFPDSFLNFHKNNSSSTSTQGPFYQNPSDTKVETLKTKVKLLSFKVKKLPVIDDEFAKKFKAKDLEDLKARIKEDLKKNTEQKEKEKLENSLLEKLVEKNPLELPKSLLEDQKERLKENTKKNLEVYKFSPSDQEIYLKKHEKEFEKEAQFSLHVSYLFEKLIQQLKMNLSPEEIEKSLKESFPNKASKEMEENLKKSHHWNQFLFHLKRKKVISYLLEKSIIKEIDSKNHS